MPVRFRSDLHAQTETGFRSARSTTNSAPTGLHRCGQPCGNFCSPRCSVKKLVRGFVIFTTGLARISRAPAPRLGLPRSGQAPSHRQDGQRRSRSVSNARIHLPHAQLTVDLGGPHFVPCRCPRAGERGLNLAMRYAEPSPLRKVADHKPPDVLQRQHQHDAEQRQGQR